MTSLTYPFVIEAGSFAETEMNHLAAHIAGVLTPPLVIYLHGDLGAGKTTFTRAVLRQLGYEGRVKSPTYGLMEEYPVANMHLVHLDLYRIEAAGELEFLGLDDLHYPQSVFLIEWPENGDSYLPQADLTINFSYSDDQRELEFVFQNAATLPIYKSLSAFFQ